MYDQIYWQLAHGTNAHYDPVSLYPEMKDYTIYIDGISKAFAGTGVRVGWAFGPQKLIDKMKSILSHIGAWSPKAEQVATAKFLADDEAVDTYLTDIKEKIETRLNTFYHGFKELRGEGYRVDAIEPQGAMYLTVQINLHGQTLPNGEKLNTTKDVTQYLLEDAKIALVPFSSFGASKNSTWYRLSVGTAAMEDIQGFFGNLKKSLAKLTL